MKILLEFCGFKELAVALLQHGLQFGLHLLVPKIKWSLNSSVKHSSKLVLALIEGSHEFRGHALREQLRCINDMGRTVDVKNVEHAGESHVLVEVTDHRLLLTQGVEQAEEALVLDEELKNGWREREEGRKNRNDRNISLVNV